MVSGDIVRKNPQNLNIVEEGKKSCDPSTIVVKYRIKDGFKLLNGLPIWYPHIGRWYSLRQLS